MSDFKTANVLVDDVPTSRWSYGYDAPKEDMTAPSREEIDAKLQAIEARMDTRVASIEGKIDTMLARLEGTQTAQALKFDHLTQQLTETRNDVTASRQEARSFRLQIVIALIGTGVAVVLGLGSINASLFETFDAGRGAGADVGALNEKMDQLRQQISDGARPAASAAPPLLPR